MNIQQVKNPITIQFIIIGILLTAIGFKYFLTDNLEDYKTIESYEKFFHHETDILNSSNDRLIQSMEVAIEKNPGYKPYVHYSKELQEEINDFKSKIDVVKNRLIENAGGRYFAKEEQFGIVQGKGYKKITEMKTKRDTMLWGLPRYYYSVKPVRQTFIKEGGTDDLVKKWKTTKEKLIKLTTIKDVVKVENTAFIDSLNERNQTALNQLNLLTILEDSTSFRQKIRKMDVMHTSFLLRTLEHELTLVEYQLLNNFLAVVSQAADPIAHNYKIMMRPEKPPKVGETFKAHIYAVPYIVADEMMEFYINGKQLKVENGIGKYNYTPKTRGTKYFDLEIRVKNPFTGKTNSYKRQQQMEVY